MLKENSTSKTPQQDLTKSKESLKRDVLQGMGNIRNLMDFGNSDVKTSSLIAQDPTFNPQENRKQYLEDDPQFSPYDVGGNFILVIFEKSNC